ncbi:MAG: hypothetical protein JSR91_24355 [Proteobacteria bacterium]|nr:hypothetical protein [Pseudomonadota bacterium]
MKVAFSGQPGPIRSVPYGATSAARVSRMLVMPRAISLELRIEQGAMIILTVRYDPLEIAAARSSVLYATSASRRTSLTLKRVGFMGERTRSSAS